MASTIDNAEVMSPANTEAIVLRRHNVEAWVDARGATLLQVLVEGKPILAGPGAVEPALGHHGAVLAPWPGRIADGRYEVAGVEHQLARGADGHALHGLVFDRRWGVRRSGRRAVTFEATIADEPGYPGVVGLRVVYSLVRRGIRCTVRWRNLGPHAAPFGVGFHPYVRPGPGQVDDWTLTVVADQVMDNDPITRLPGIPHSTDPDRDFMVPRKIGEDRWSRAYGSLARRDGIAEIRVATTDGDAVEILLCPAFRWVQIFTGDLSDPALSRQGLAVEPQTCPPNSFRTGVDRQILRPGERGNGAWELRVPPRAVTDLRA